MPRIDIENKKRKNNSYAKNNSNNTGDFFSDKKFLVIILFLLFQTLFLGYKNFDYITNILSSPESDTTIIADNNDTNDDTSYENSLTQSEILDKKLNRKKKVTDKSKKIDKIVKSDKNKSNKVTKKNIKKDIKKNNKATSEPIRINIKNGCGVTGIAAKWQTKLRKVNYDVIDASNAKKINESTIICRNKGMKSEGYKLAKLLGISKKQVVVQPSKTIIVDLELVIGKDYRKLKSPR